MRITCIDTNMYLVIKQLFQCYFGNSRNYHPSVGGSPGELFALGLAASDKQFLRASPYLGMIVSTVPQIAMKQLYTVCVYFTLYGFRFYVIKGNDSCY